MIRKEIFTVKFMGFSLIMIGMLFLLGPDIGVFDLLPDFVGYILILKGLSSLSKINSDFSDSSKYFKWCLCVALAKLPLYVMCIIMSKSDSFITLLCVFVCGLMDGIFAYNAFSAFFNGLSSSSVADKGNPNYRCSVFFDYEKIRKFTLAFVILKPLLYIAPELTRLDSNEFGEVTSDGIITLYSFYNVIVVLTTLTALIIGIVWYVKIRKYLKNVISDSFFIKTLEDKYNTEFKNDQLKIQSFNILRTLSFLTVAFVFLLKVQLDGINYVPPFVFPAIVFAASLFMKDVVKCNIKRLRLFSVISTLVNLVYWIYNIVFVNSFIIIDNTDYGMTLSYAEQLDMMMNSDFNTLYGFIGLCAISFAASAVSIVMLVDLFKAIWYIAKFHAFNHFDEKYDILSSSSDTFETESNQSTIRLFKASRAFGYIVVAFEFISTALTTVYPELVQGVIRSIQGYSRFAKIVRSILTNITPSLWTIDFVLRIVLIILICVLISRIRDAYKTKNYLE